MSERKPPLWTVPFMAWLLIKAAQGKLADVQRMRTMRLAMRLAMRIYGRSVADATWYAAGRFEFEQEEGGPA